MSADPGALHRPPSASRADLVVYLQPPLVPSDRSFETKWRRALAGDQKPLQEATDGVREGASDGEHHTAQNDHLKRAEARLLGPAHAAGDDQPVVFEAVLVVALQMADGRNQQRVEEDGLVVYGRMGWAKQARLSPMKMIVLRCVMLTVGRAFPNAVRRLLQRLLVTGKSRAPFRFKRMIAWEQDGLKVYDEVRANRGWQAVKRAGIGGHQTSIAVVMSRVFEPSQLQPWQDISDRLKDLPADAPLTVERSL